MDDELRLTGEGEQRRERRASPPALRPYQADGIAWLRARDSAGKNAILGDEMGLGKTGQALTALPERARALVVCPSSVVLVWEEEVRVWRPDLRAVPFASRAPGEGCLAISAYDSLPEIDPRRVRLVSDDMTGVTLVLDEAHRASSPTAQRTRKVRRLVRQCRRAWGLTGTPMTGTPDHLMELLVTLDLFGEIFPGRAAPEEGGAPREETGAEEFHRLCGTTRREFWDRRARRRRTYPVWGEISPAIKERVRTVMLRRERAGNLDLPPARWLDVPCPAPADLREYLDLVTEEWDRYDQSELPPIELYSAATAALARSRAGAARDLAEDVARGCPVIVFSAHLSPLREVCRLPGTGEITGDKTIAERRRAVSDFREGRTRILAMSLTAGGEGLNLPEAGAVILVDEDYLPSTTDQAVARAARPGQRREEVLVYRMTSLHPLDLRIREILETKRRMIAAAVPNSP